jgi:hypothetical protein
MMDKNQTSQGARAGVLSSGGQQLFWTRLFLPALFLVISLLGLQPGALVHASDQMQQGDKHSLTSLQPVAAAPDCDACERALVECLASGGGSSCAAQYNACIENCNF